MSFTSGYGKIIKSNEQSTFSSEEILSYSFKNSLNKIQTDLKTLWYNEPNNFVPISPDQIYKNKIPNYNEIGNYLLIDPNITDDDSKPIPKVTNITVSQITQLDAISSYKLADILDTNKVRNNSNYSDLSDSDYVDGANRTQIKKLSRNMFTRYIYWKNQLTGKRSKIEGGLDESTESVINHGTYTGESDLSVNITNGNFEPFNAMITYDPSTNKLSGSRIWSNIDLQIKSDISNNVKTFYEKLINLAKAIPIIHPDFKNESNPLSKAHPFMEIYVQLPLYSTIASTNLNLPDTINTLEGEDVVVSDNIGFTNPVLKKALGDTNNYPYKIMGFKGSSWVPQTNSVDNVLYFLNNPGYILLYGVGNIAHNQPLSARYPPMVSFIKYSGETLVDSFIQQMNILPDPVLFKKGDLIIETSSNVFYRLDLSNNTKEWIKVGGSNTFNANLEVDGNINFTGTLLQNSEPFETSKWIENENEDIYRLSKVGINRENPEVELDVSGNARISGRLSVADPSNNLDAVNKQYLDEIVENLDSTLVAQKGQLIRAESDISANAEYLNQETGNLYFNTKENLYKLYHSDVNNGSWLNTEIGQISSQPPPILDLSYNATTSYVDLIWRNPLQLPTSLTSDISYNTEHSPAVLQHPITDKNMIYFPIINRICIKLRPIDVNGNVIGNYESYQLYTSNNQKVVSSQSQVENNGWVIYRKGDKVAGQNGSSRENYVSELNPNRNLAINMPNKLRIYKVVPSEYNFNVSDISDTILPFILPDNPLSKGAEGYRVEIWLENNSLHPVNIKTIDVLYDVAPAPLEPELVETTFKSTENVNYNNISNKNPLVSCKLEVEDPLYVSGNNNDQDELVNFTMIDFTWSVDNNNWNKFSKISLVENGSISTNNILDGDGNYNINRPVDPRIHPRKRYEYEFKLNNEYMTSVESTDLFSNPNRNKLYLRVGYKNGSNPDLGGYKDHELDFDTPTKPLVVDISYNNTKPDTLTTVDFTVQDPSSIIIGNNTQNIKITGIKFEWSVNDTNTWYNLIKLEEINNNNNAINLNNNGIQLLNQNNNTTRKYRFDIDSNFMGSNFTSLLANGLQTLKLRISYRNSAKIVFGDVEMDSLVLDRPSIPQNAILSFNNTNNLTESKCKLVATPPTNVIINNPYANSFTNRNNITASIKITGIKFEWGVSSTNNSDVSWNNFNKIFKGSERELSGGVWDVNLPISDNGVLGDFFFNVNESYMNNILSLLTNNDGTKYLFTRISYRNSVKPEFSDVKISNVLIFDKPSIPQEIKLQYLLNNSNSNTLCKLDFKDPVNLLGNNTVNNSILQFTGIKYEWSINNNDWNEVQKINVSSNVVTLNNGVYDLSFNHSTSLRTYNIFITSDYLVSNVNSSTDFTTLTTNISTDLYLRVSYRNSSKSELSETITSNFLRFINPTVPRNITLDYMETDSNSITKYNMVITDPSYILSYYNDIDASNVNAIVKITDIELEWSINGSSWNDFINIVENGFNSNNLNNLANGLYSRTRLLTNSTTYIFDLSDNYMNNILTLVYNGLSNNQLPYRLYTKTAYRNSTTTRLSPDLSSNVLYFDRPSEPRLVSIEYNNTTTSKVSRVKLTVLDPSNVINYYNDSYNDIIKYTGLKMEWDTDSNFTVPKNLLLIEDGSNQSMVGGIYTTLKAHSDSNRTFYFDMSDNFMSDFNTDVFTNNDATDIYLRVSHRNSTLSNFSNFTISNLLKSDVPSVPNSVVLTYDSVVAGIQRLNIAVKDPLNTVNYYGTSVNTKVNMTNIKFEWSVDNSKWNLFNNMIVSEGTISNGVNAINRLRDNTIRNYKFDLTSTYLANDDASLNQLLLNGGNLYVRVSYQNSTKNSFSETTESNIIYLTPPTEPRIVSIDYKETLNDKTTRLKIEVTDPSFVLSYYDDINSDNVNNLVKYDGYKFEWATEPDGVLANWTNLKQIIDTNDALDATTKTSLDSNGILSRLKTHRDSSRTFYFDLSSNDLNGDVNSLVLNKSKVNSTNIYVRLSYRNTVVDTFSGTTQSNEIVSDVPSAPNSVVLTYDSVNSSVQRLNIAVVDPLNTINYYGTGKNNLVNMTNIKFEWSTDNNNWQLFNNIIDPNNNVLSNVNGVYNINRFRDSTTRNYKFDLTSTYLANNNTALSLLLSSGGNLYVRVSYQNSTKSAYSNETSSNVVLTSPSKPDTVTLTLKQPTGTPLTSLTECNLAIKDPLYSNNGVNTDNSKIFVNAIKFEWSINGTTWNNFLRINLGGYSNLSSGEYSLPTKRAFDTNTRDYTFVISNSDLNNFTTLTAETELRVRVSYRNTLITNLGATETSSITFGVPSTPTILDVSMNSSTTINIRLPIITNQNKINGSGGSVATNNNSAIFIKEVQILPQRKLDNGNYENLPVIDYSYNGLSNNNAISSYIYNIPTGLLNGTVADNNYRLEFIIRLKNNVVNEWSNYSSNVQNDSVENTQNLYIEQILPENTINTVVQNGQDAVNLSWNHPANLKRGVLKAGNTIPIVYDYSVNVYDSVNTGIITNVVNTATNRTTDAVNIRNSVAINTILQNTVDLNQIGETRTLKIDVNQRNEYIRVPSKITRDYFYRLDLPNNPVLTSSTSNIVAVDNSLNNIVYKWNKPLEPGLKTGNLSNSLSEVTSLAVNQYVVEISANRLGSTSPYYRSLDLVNQPSLTVTVTANPLTSNANTYLSATNGLINKNSTFANVVGTVSNVLVYPETTYNINIRARNRYNLTNNGVTTTITTGIPNAIINQYDNTTLPIGSTNISSYTKYTNKGFIKGDVLKTSVKITKAHNLTSSLSSNQVSHRINQNRLNLLLSPENINITDISNLNLRQFRIVNLGNNNEIIYKLGLDNKLYDTSLNTYGITSITSNSRTDMYARANFDGNNRGYWWMETVSYNISFSSRNDNLYGKPVRLNLQVRYNKETTNYSSSSLENDSNVNVFNRDILLDSTTGNSNNAYFDKLNGVPTISNISVMELANNNKINGLPNLYPISGKSYNYGVKYVLGNYSEYYELQSNLNVSSLDLVGSTINKSNISNFTFDTSNNFEISRGLTTWDVSSLTFTNINVGSITGVDKEINLRINATNTDGNNNQLFTSNTFINDSVSVIKLSSVLNASSATTVPSNITLPTDKGQLIKVPDGFTPHIPAYASDATKKLLNNNVDEVFNNYETYNSYQLHMYNGYYGSTEWLRLQLGGTGGDLNALKTKYNLPTLATETDVSYSYSIFKFVRRNLQPADLNYNLFVISFGSDNNITYDDLVNDDVKVMVQVYSRTINAPINVNLIDYASSGSETNFSGKKYNWAIYKPNTTATLGSTTGQTSLLGSSAGLGTNSILSNNVAEFNTGKSNLPNRASILNSTYYDFNGNKALLGFFAQQNLLSDQSDSNATELVFYVAVGIRNGVNKYFKEIQSLDIYTDTNGLSR
jgi:uncharacterized membrane protein